MTAMKWFQNLSTMKKLILGFSTVCVIVATMGYLGANGAMAIRENLRIVYEDYTVAATDLAKASQNLLLYCNNFLRIQRSTDAAELSRLVTRQNELRDSMTKPLDAYAATTLRVSQAGRDEKRDLDTFRKALGEYFRVVEANIPLAEQALRATTEDEANAIRATLTQNARTVCDDRLREAGAALDELLLTITDVAKDMNEDGKATAASAMTTMIGGTIFAVFLSLGLGVFIARLVSRPLAQAVEVLNRVAGGDFTMHLDLDSKDEVGQMAIALNKAVDGIRIALTEVRTVADGLASASQQLSAASEEISSGAQEQASNLEETASSLEEITSTVKQNADNAQQANQLATGARDVAEKGGKVVNEAVDGMNEINQASKKIADIITAIDEIAFQTNLLALNAAVEAARAGEQGRGFAVVAGEVRNLAQRSAGAAKEIKGLIQDSVRKVENGSELVNKSGQTLQEIVTSVKRVTDIVAEIAAASREQSTGIDQVSKAVAQMDTVTQANASQTEELSGTAEALSGQANQLQQLVAKFQLGDHAGSTPAPAAHVSHVAKANGQARAATPRHVEPKTNGKHTNGHHHELELVGTSNGANRLNGHFEEF